MPFPLRTVSPLRLCRLEEEAPRDKEEPPGARGLRFGSLEEVCAHSLVSLLWQLSDLSRCAGDIFGGIQSQVDRLGRRSGQLQRRLDAVKALAARLDHRKVPVPVSNLDEESRWTVHYTAPWHQQENVFLPSSRPACVEDLHRQAKLNLKSVLRECDKLRRDGYRSSQYYSQGPTFSSSSSAIYGSYQDDYEEIGQKCSTPSPEEEKLITIKRPRTPVSNEFSDINTQTNWTKSLPLPTPEEKMRQQAQAVQTDVIPINVTGENFDRQASIRRSLIYTDTVVRRPKKVKRRKTITGIPDNIQRELAVGTGKCDIRSHSLYVPDRYSTLGRLDSYRCSMQHCDTKDSSCQTEEVKVVPPSVRRIRAQKGQGIAAQMSLLSSSSGNMSVMSDSAGVVFPSRLNNDLGFHSLPRSGARVSLQLLERRHSLSKSTEDGTLSHSIGRLQVDGSIDHLRNGSRTDILSRTKSQEVRNSEREQAESPACMVSPHATYSTSIIPNATLSSSSEVIVIHTTHSAGSMDSKITSSSSYSKPRDSLVANSVASTRDQHNSSSGTWSETSLTHNSHSSDTTISSNAVTVHTLGDSGVCLSGAGNLDNAPQSLIYNYRNNLNFPSHSRDSENQNELSYSGEKTQGRVLNSTEYSGLKCSGNKETPIHTVNCATAASSTPVSTLSTGSLERVSGKEDSSSLYSVDHDGYYTSMHVDSGLQSGKACSNNGFVNPRHNVTNAFDGVEKKSLGALSTSSDKSLSRSISLKKAKKPPLPPSRTDSLRRIPKKKSQSNGQVLDDTLIASLQHSLQLNFKSKNGSSPSQSPCSDYDDPWVLRSRSQSSVSASSSMMSATGLNMYSICAVTPSQSETSSIKSEYAEQWGYYSDCPGMPDDQLKSPVVHSANSAPKVNEYNVSISHPDGTSKASAPHGPSGLSKPKIMSPEKPHRVTSPSSGYSSQSNTPTALTPVPVLLKSGSTGSGRPKTKPKVPERKSSLLSSVSVSSSSTSLSSNASAEGSVSLKKSEPSLSFPVVTSSQLMSPDSTDPLLLPPPPPPSVEGMDLSPPPGSPNFPPPPPEAVASASFPQNVSWYHCRDSSGSHFFPSTLPLPPPPPSSSVPPPAPPLDPKFTKDPYKQAPYSSTKYIQEASFHNTMKQPLNKEELPRPTMPLVTTQALQMVQLRSVRRAAISEAERPVESTSKTYSQEKLTECFSAPLPLKPCVSMKQNENAEDGEVKPQSISDKTFVYSLSQRTYPSLSDGRAQHTSNKMPRDSANLVHSFTTDLPQANSEEALEENQGSPCDLPSSSLQGESGFLNKPQGMSPNKKPPPVSKKPKLFVMVPPPQPDVAAEKIAEVGEAVRSSPVGTTNDAAVAQSSQAEDYPADGLSFFEMDTGSLVPGGGGGGGAVSSPACDTLESSRASTVQPTEEEQTCILGDISTDQNGDSLSVPQRHLPQGDESAEVSESDAATILLLQSPVHGEGNEMVAMPARPRTTEDLFAAIHRSKRKVLGRKDSEEDHGQNHSPSPPVTPTGASPNLPSLKQAGSIQRSVRKSSTSNDNFKALLLKKGSRSDTSSRMSAAEMLKNTDPRFQRAKADSPWENLNDSTTSPSPTKSRRAQEEWAKSEGLMPRSLSFSSARYSRSRTPPSAASSKYNVRNRIQSSPMTVISEGDIEATEPGENRTHKSLGEGQLEVFDSDEIDFEEDGGSRDNTTVHPDLVV